MRKREFLQVTGGAGFAAFVAALGAPVQAWAVDDKEVVFYANMTAVEPIMQAFQKSTGIQGKYTRISDTQFLATVLTESDAGKLLADVLQAPRPIIELIKARGLLQPYKSPSAKDYPAWATADPEVTMFGIEYVSYVYNSKLVKAEDAPKTYEDLADARWKQRIVMANPAVHTSTIQWLVGLNELVFKSEETWMNFVKAVAANKPMFVASFGPTPEPIASGQVLIGISMPKYIVTKAPAPLAWGPTGGQPLLGTARAMGINKASKRVAAAHAFMDYWLSQPAMEELAKKVGEYVLYPDIFPPVPGIEKVEVKPVRDLTDDELKSWGQKFGAIFGAR